MNTSILPSSFRTTFLLLGLTALFTLPTRADVNSDLAFSAFKSVDLNSLDSGTVMQARGGLINFPRGITTQSLYIIHATPADVASKLVHWNPATHSNLKVWIHASLPAKPTPADFSGLSNLPNNSSMQFQYKSTAKMDPESPSLLVSKSEAQLIASAAAQQKDPKALFASVWSQILATRANNFLSGHGDTDSDVDSSGSIRPLGEVKSLLHADPKIYGQYQHLLNQTPVKTLAGTATAMLPPAELYYDIFDVQGSASTGTGAIYQAPSGNSLQSLDVEYFTNYGVYTTVELEQLWPITINGHEETLVWRADLVSAPNIAYLHGTERLASGMIMLQEVKEAVDAFKAEFK